MRYIPLVLLAIFASNPVLAQNQPRMISVIGHGTVVAAPDMATISVGVEVFAGSAEVAIRQNSAQMQAVFGALSEVGVETKDMQTSQLTLYPRWDNGEGAPEASPAISGYVAGNMVVIKVRALDRLGLILDRLTQAGANQIQSINFGIQEPLPLEDAARQAAVADALARANLYAEAANLTLGDILSISETVIELPGPQMMAMSRDAAGSMAVPIANGEMVLSADISMVLLIE